MRAVLIGRVRCVFTQGHFVTRDPLILLALREREAQPSHKINYVNEWILSITEEFWSSRAPLMRSILNVNQTASYERPKENFGKVDHSSFELREVRLRIPPGP